MRGGKLCFVDAHSHDQQVDADWQPGLQVKKCSSPPGGLPRGFGSLDFLTAWWLGSPSWHSSRTRQKMYFPYVHALEEA